MAEQSPLILPGTLEFYLECQELPPPPGWLNELHKSGGERAIIAPLGTNGMMEVVTLDRAMEYMHDGELDQRMDEIEELEADIDLWLPGDY